MKVTDKLFYLNNTSSSETKFMLIIHVDDSQGDETLQILGCIYCGYHGYYNIARQVKVELSPQKPSKAK